VGKSKGLVGVGTGVKVEVGAGAEVEVDSGRGVNVAGGGGGWVDCGRFVGASVGDEVAVLGSVAVESGGGTGVRVGVILGVRVGRKVGAPSTVPSRLASWLLSVELAAVSRKAAVAGEPGVLVGSGVSGTAVGSDVKVGVWVGLRLSPNKKNAPTARTISNTMPPMISSSRGSFMLRPFFWLGWATTGSPAAEAVGLPREIVFGAEVISVGSTPPVKGTCSIKVDATGTASAPGRSCGLPPSSGGRAP
jgi:hypothetical protein